MLHAKDVFLFTRGLGSEVRGLYFFLLLFFDSDAAPDQISAALTSAARGNAGIWSQWPPGNLRAPGPVAIPALPRHHPSELW